MKVERATECANKLRELAKRHGSGRPSVIVGYSRTEKGADGETFNVALAVHEGTGLYGPSRQLIFPRKADPGTGRQPVMTWVGKDGKRVFATSTKGIRGRKFLEGPARRLNNTGELGTIMAAAVKRGDRLAYALYLGGLRIQRDSQAECPVDTGFLRASAFTEIESEGNRT